MAALPIAPVTTENQQAPASNTRLAALLPALHRLDAMLDAAVRAMQSSQGSETATSFQGLFISRDQVGRLLLQEPGQAQFRLAHDLLEQNAGTPTGESPFTWLIDSFGLSSFGADVVLLALAPEIDLRYEKIYSYLQDDVTRKRPTIDLVLNLLCASADEKLSCRAHFSSSAPLIRHRLLNVFHDPNQVEPSSLAHYVRLDDQIRRLLLGQTGLDERLSSFCRLNEVVVAWTDLSLSADVKQALPKLAQDAISSGKPLRLYFQGAAIPEKRETAAALAGVLGCDLLSVRVDRVPDNLNPDLLWSLVAREAQLHRAVLFISDLDDFPKADGGWRRQDLFDGVAAYKGITIFAGKLAREPRSIVPFGIIPVDFQVPDFHERYERWECELSKVGAKIAPTIYKCWREGSGLHRCKLLERSRARSLVQNGGEHARDRNRLHSLLRRRCRWTNYQQPRGTNAGTNSPVWRPRSRRITSGTI